MATIGTAYVQVLPSVEGIQNNLKSALSGPAADAGNSAGTESGQSFLGSMTGKIKSGLATVAKVGTAALAAASTAVVALTKNAVDSYAEYEQLVGGVETLFKGSADTVQQYAANAYQTAGLSANEYMETVTSFSASLLQSLGGDTQAAAEYADMAITDMSDNANKMGTSMEAIQNAYQGFAKQNYTMLDNLKLGYGGTKEEMQRLIDDANKLRAAQGLNADLTIDSYADIVTAIHDVQTEMGITGTTAKEASSTIQGSLAATKSAWKNLMTGFGDSNADIGSLVDNVVDSAATAFGNLMPVIEQAFSGIGKAVEKIAPVIAEKLPKIAKDILPSLLSAAVSLVDSLAASLPSFITSVVDAIIAALPMLIQGAIKLVAGLVGALPEIVSGLIAAIPDILAAIVEGFAPIIEGLGGLFGQAWEAIKNVFAPIGEWFTQRKEDVQNAFASVGEWFSEKFTAAKDAVHSAWESIGGWFSDRWSDITSAFSDAEGWFSTKFTAASDAVHTAWSGIGTWFSDKWTEIQNVFNNAKQIFSEIGGNIVQGIKDGILAAWERFTGWVTEKFNNLVGGVKSLLGISSPSKVFATIGDYMVQGLGQGWDKAFGQVKSGIEDDLNFSGSATMGQDFRSFDLSPRAIDMASQAGTVTNTITTNVYAAPGQSAEEIAQKVERRIAQNILSREAVWA